MTPLTMAVPLKVFIFGKIMALLLIFLLSLGVLVVSKKLGWTWPRSSLAGFALAIGLAIGYSYLIEVPMASASYTPGGIYYYTSDHIGRPFNLRDSTEYRTLKWYEQHLAFGEPITEWGDTNPPITAGVGDYLISWQPSFRFPGQFQDPDMGLSYTDSSLFVQNHYREYMPGLGRYNSVDPYSKLTIQSAQPHIKGSYTYSSNNSIAIFDIYGLCTSCSDCPFGLYAYHGLEYGGFVFFAGAHSLDLTFSCKNKPAERFTMTMTCIGIGGGLGGGVGYAGGIVSGCNRKEVENNILGFSIDATAYPMPYFIIPSDPAPDPGLGLSTQISTNGPAVGFTVGAGLELSGGGYYCWKVY